MLHFLKVFETSSLGVGFTHNFGQSDSTGWRRRWKTRLERQGSSSARLRSHFLHKQGKNHPPPTPTLCDQNVEMVHFLSAKTRILFIYSHILLYTSINSHTVHRTGRLKCKKSTKQTTDRKELQRGIVWFQHLLHRVLYWNRF